MNVVNNIAEDWMEPLGVDSFTASTLLEPPNSDSTSHPLAEAPRQTILGHKQSSKRELTGRRRRKLSSSSSEAAAAPHISTDIETIFFLSCQH